MKDSYVLVTGGTRGIGRAICNHFAALGYNVVFTYKTNTALSETLVAQLKSEHQIECLGISADMLDVAALEKIPTQIPETFGALHCLVHNAGMTSDGLIMRTSVDQFDETFGTNVRGAYFLTKAYSKLFLKQRSGSIIFIGSVIGETGNAGQSLYAASKSALEGLVRSLAQELAPRNIRVNLVTPGFIESDMTKELPEATKADIFSKIPLARFGTPEDVAHTVGFLASKQAAYITGQSIAINGGMHC